MPDLKLKFITLADYATVSEKGKISIIGLFEQMFVKEAPSKFLRCFFVAIIEGKPNSEAKVRFSVKSPSGKEVIPAKDLLIKTGIYGIGNILFDVTNLPLPKTGEYKLSLKSGKKNLGSTSFYVLKARKSGDQRSSKIIN